MRSSDQPSPEPFAEAERAILAYLAGLVPLTEAAIAAGMQPSDLADAARRYQSAGQAALGAVDEWQQFNVEFADASVVDQVAVSSLFPALARAQENGHLRAWWFLRKSPGLRIRVAPADLSTEVFARALDDARQAGHIVRWRTTIYEPETAVFGGDTGMTLAHETFASDSTGIARWLHDDATSSDRVLPSLILMTHLQRAAGLDWNERGDVWAKVAAQRAPHGLPAGDFARLTEQAHTVLTADAHAVTHGAGAFAAAASWADALDQHGRDLADAARDGRLTRGLREILSLHTIFHWNRMGLTAAAQAVWASAAATAVFDRRDR